MAWSPSWCMRWLWDATGATPLECSQARLTDDSGLALLRSAGHAAGLQPPNLAQLAEIDTVYHNNDTLTTLLTSGSLMAWSRVNALACRAPLLGSDQPSRRPAGSPQRCERAIRLPRLASTRGSFPRPVLGAQLLILTESPATTRAQGGRHDDEAARADGGGDAQ